MTPNEIRIKIAERCGWHWSYCNGNKKWAWFFKNSNYKSELTMDEYDKAHHIYCLPDYSNSLDAMHEAEKVLTNQQRREYVEHLVNVHPLHYHPYDLDHEVDNMNIFHLVHITSQQRAEAFLRVFGDWKD